MARWWLLVLTVGAVWVATPHPAIACGLHFSRITPGRSFRQEIAEANLVLFGTLSNADKTPRPNAPDGTTDLVIEKVIKNHDWLKDRKVVTLPRYVDRGPDSNKYRYLVFVNFFKDRLDPYRGIEVKADSDTIKYLEGILAIKTQNPRQLLRFYLDYLENKEVEISNDAFTEVTRAKEKDLRAVAKEFSPDRLTRWLKDPKTPSYRSALYGLMLGVCGKEEHATLLRHLLDKPNHEFGRDMDGMLAGYVMLKPKEGWDYLQGILKDPTKKFLHRYAALRAVRFFWDIRPDLITKKQAIAALTPLLEMKDIADMVVGDFRRWKRFDLTDRVLGLQNSTVYSVAVVRRSILRFAVQAPGEAAAAYVAAQRKNDPEGVEDVEEMLKLDASEPAPQK